MPAAIALLTGDTFTDATLNSTVHAAGGSRAAYTNNDNEAATATTLSASTPGVTY